MGVLTEIYESLVIEYDDDGNKVVFVAAANFDTSGPIRLTIDDIGNINLGYCVTVHKAQGSQWERVVVVSEFVSRRSPVVDNTWFYTAVTRCQKQAVLVGSHESFNYHVARQPRSFSRKIGLNFLSQTMGQPVYAH